jgi:hypothetical protein
VAEEKKQLLGAVTIPHDEWMATVEQVMKENAEALRILAKK